MRLGSALLALASGARAEPVSVEELERRVEELESRSAASEAAPGAAAGIASELADWAQYVRLGGSAEAGFFGGGSDSVTSHDQFEIWDTRLFVDAELGEEFRAFGHTLVRNIGLSFEWNLVRIGSLANEVGELYAEFQGLGGSPWLDLRVGRFQLPVGESYLRYSRGRGHDFFVSTPLGGPWWWDEGVLLHGASPSGRLGYVASVSSGETPMNVDTGDGEQYTLKLWTRPAAWLYLSASGLYGGEIGPATGALWLGESWARPFGSGSSLPNFVDGASVPDGPSSLDESWLAAADAVLSPAEGLRLWLGYGRYAIDAGGAPGYDRTLHYWIAELLLEGQRIHPELAPAFAGFRADALGSYDRDRGYLLDGRYAETLGYNMESLTGYTALIGWRFGRHVRVRAEYSHRVIELVSGASALRPASRDADAFAVEVGVRF